MILKSKNYEKSFVIILAIKNITPKVFLFLILLTEILLGQSIIIQGYVKDKFSNIGLDLAQVILINKTNQSIRDTFYTNNNGFFIFTLTNVFDTLYPEVFHISNAYPNPFNPSTNFDIYLPQEGNLKISVYSILGKLLNEKNYYLPAGNHKIEYKGIGSAGIYLLKFEFGKTSFVKKIVQTDFIDQSDIEIRISKKFSTSNILNKINTNYYLLIAQKFAYVPDTIEVDDSQNREVNFYLEQVHQNAILIDLHNDVLEKVVNGYDLGKFNTINHSDLPRFYLGGVDVQFMALWVNPSTYPNNAFQQTLKMIDSFYVQLNRYNSIFAQARNYKEIDSLVKIKKFAAILAVEGGHAIEESLDKLDSLYKLGVRYMTITWNNSTSWATAAADPQSATRGLSEFGRQVIRKMDSLGIIIDVSHTGIKTIEDILSTTTNPIIASHSGVRSLRNHYRNLTDQQIINIAQRGGVIGVIFYPPFLTSTNTANFDTVIKHIDYIRNLVGIDHIALGSDFDGIERVVIGLENVSKFPNLTIALLKKGYSISDIRKIYGENILRVIRQVCK